ncbi:MAG TPA: hypothetical protein VE244_00390 [Nitrososphaeraceae archaeon]|nr:hypothetical protein [Nitrososphaeraceae archaeon]
MKIKPLIGPHGKMPILIRDDDTNFLPDQISLKQSILRRGIKVSK